MIRLHSVPGSVQRSAFALATAALIASPVAAFAQSISGHVLDAESRPIEGATVSVSELHRSATTAANGAFEVTSLPLGHFTVVARRIGYAPSAREVVLDQVGQTLDLTFRLEEGAFRIEPVNVTVAREPVDALRSPLPTSVLADAELHHDAGISLAHSLASLPGVQSVSTGQQIGKPMIRGLYGSRVLVVHDGSRLEDYSWSEEDGPSIDARLAQRVEVIRGPASVLYGSDAIGGVINVIPDELPTALGTAPFVHATAEAYLASNNIELGSAAKLEGASGAYGWRLFGTGRFASSYHTPNGEVDNTGFGAANVDAAFGRRTSRGNTTLRFSHYGGEFKLLEANGPATPVPAGAADAGPERKLLDDRLQLANDLFVGSARLETKLQYQRHSLIEVSDDCPPGQPNCATATSGPTEHTAFDLLLNTTDLDVLLHHALGSAVSGTVGVSGMYQTNDSRGPIYLVPSATTSSVGAFAFEQAAAGPLTFSAGGRFDVRALDADANTQLALAGDSRRWRVATGDVGAAYRILPSVAVTANFGSAWRAPTLFDLYANGPHLAEARYEIGDSTLVPEHSLNGDVGLRWEGARAHAELSFFRNAIAHYIYTTPTAAFQDSLRVFRHAQADALLTGGEGSVEVRVAQPLVLRARHDFVRGTNQQTDEPLPLMAPARTAIGGELASSHLSWANRASFGAEVEHVWKQTRLNPEDFPTDAYSVLNLDLEAERALVNRNFRFELDVRNATNTAYRNFLSRYKEFALEPGANVIFRVSTEF